MIDPDRRGYMGVRLVVKRPSGSGAPRRPKKHDNLAQFLMLHAIVFDDSKVEAVVATAAERFEVGRSTAFDVLRKEQEYWEKHPDRLRLFRDDAMQLRALGKPEFQPL